MRPYRSTEDPWGEAEHLGVTPIIRNLGWTRRRLDTELERHHPRGLPCVRDEGVWFASTEQT